MTLSIRLDAELERELSRACARSGLPKSQIVKQSLREYLARFPGAKTSYELGKDLFGQHGSGLGDLGERRKEYLAKGLRAKRAR
jgi:hypothetical protein